VRGKGRRGKAREVGGERGGERTDEVRERRVREEGKGMREIGGVNESGGGRVGAEESAGTGVRARRRNEGRERTRKGRKGKGSLFEVRLI